jgi:hypothetical protein
MGALHHATFNFSLLLYRGPSLHRHALDPSPAHTPCDPAGRDRLDGLGAGGAHGLGAAEIGVRIGHDQAQSGYLQ